MEAALRYTLGGPQMTAMGADIPTHIAPFISPFDPEGTIQDGVDLDFLREREWRVPRDYAFEPSNVKFIIVNSLKDASEIVERFGVYQYPHERFIVMDTWRKISAEWGS